MRKPVAFVGHSGSGKTTLVCRLVEHLVSAGRSVAVIKHTHHEVSQVNRGDTERFLTAGATEAVLADDFQAVHFDRNGTSRWAWSHPSDLLRVVRSEVVLVEGFKSFGPWPKILVTGGIAGAPPAISENLVAVVSSSPSASDLPRFAPDEIAGLASFVDKISLA